jgi:DNA helicase-2/ATP-dependent DNA helicase PcrA
VTNGAGGHWAEGLTGPIRRIAETSSSPLRVLAGPGTGKTFALIRRVMRLVEEGADPGKIFVCTFTRTAAKDLETALRASGVTASALVRAGTVHSFCFSVLSRAEVFEIMRRFPRPLLKFEERFLLEDLRGPIGEGIRDLTKQLNAFSASWARLNSDEPGWPQDARDQRFWRALEAWLRFHQAMLIGELVPVTLTFVRENPRSPFRPRFDHLLVDEYQDLNRAEQALLDELSVYGTISIVGDEAQSIYSFKYAHPEGIANFNNTHPGTHDECLVECRRCPKAIVSMANSLIGHNSSQEACQLQIRSSNPIGEILVVQWASIQEESEGLARFIKQRIQGEGILPGKVLILSPRRQIGYTIRDALSRLDLSVHSFFYEEALEGDPKNLYDCAAQEAFTLLTLLARPEDKVALRSWCGFGSNSLHSGSWARVRLYSETTNDSPREIFEKILSRQLIIPSTGRVAERYRVLKQRLSELEDLTGNDLIDAIFPQTEAWAGQIRGLVSGLGADVGPIELLEYISHAVTQPELPTDVDYIRVMSLHKSKGLTANLVVVAGCIEGLIPTIQTGLPPQDDRRMLEEQRRLFYVAITRTTGILVLSSITSLPCAEAFKMGAKVQIRRRGQTPVPTIASRFLTELGPSRPITVDGATILRA